MNTTAAPNPKAPILIPKKGQKATIHHFMRDIPAEVYDHFTDENGNFILCVRDPATGLRYNFLYDFMKYTYKRVYRGGFSGGFWRIMNNTLSLS